MIIGFEVSAQAPVTGHDPSYARASVSSPTTPWGKYSGTLGACVSAKALWGSATSGDCLPEAGVEMKAHRRSDQARHS